MSWRMPAEYGAISTLAANHRTLSEISQRVSRLLPTSRRMKMASTNGSTAVTTRAGGSDQSKRFPG